MTLPRRIRLIKNCREHLLNKVLRTLATDKEVRTIKDFDRRISNYYMKQTEHEKVA